MKLATFRARLGAFLVDGVLVGLLFGLLLGLLPLVAGGALCAVGYFGLATYLGKGVTPGKRLFRIRVVCLYHDHLSFWHSIERALGYSASALEAGFGFLQYFTHPNRQTVHDRIAETLVIDTRDTSGGFAGP